MARTMDEHDMLTNNAYQTSVEAAVYLCQIKTHQQ